MILQAVSLATHRKQQLVISLLLLAVITSAMTVVYMKHQSRRLFVELEKLNKQRDGMNTEWRQLQLEQSTWATHSRIESVATQKLRMRNVEYENTVIIKL